MHAIEALPCDYRVVFVRHEIEGTPIPKLAISANTAHSRLRLARRDFAVAVRWFDRRRR